MDARIGRRAPRRPLGRPDCVEVAPLGSLDAVPGGSLLRRSWSSRCAGPPGVGVRARAGAGARASWGRGWAAEPSPRAFSAVRAGRSDPAAPVRVSASRREIADAESTVAPATSCRGLRWPVRRWPDRASIPHLRVSGLGKSSREACVNRWLSLRTECINRRPSHAPRASASAASGRASRARMRRRATTATRVSHPVDSARTNACYPATSLRTVPRKALWGFSVFRVDAGHGPVSPWARVLAPVHSHQREPGRGRGHFLSLLHPCTTNHQSAEGPSRSRTHRASGRLLCTRGGEHRHARRPSGCSGVKGHKETTREEKHLRTLGLCLLAAFSLAAITASTASAKLPEWGGCEAKAEGKYEDSACTVKAHPKKTNGHYEWYAGPSFPRGGITGYNLAPVEIGPATFETKNARKIECANSEESVEGPSRIQLEAPKRIREALLNFTQCHESSVAPEEGKNCHSPGFRGLEPGGDELISDGLAVGSRKKGIQGTLVYVADKGTSSPTLGLSLEPFRTTKQRKEEGFPTGNRCSRWSARARWGPSKSAETNKGGNSRHLADLTRRSDQSPIKIRTRRRSPQSAGIQDPAKPEKGGEKTLRTEFQNLWEPIGLSSTFTDQGRRRCHPAGRDQSDPVASSRRSLPGLSRPGTDRH